MPTPTRGARRLLAALSIAAFVAGSFGMVPAAAQHPSTGSGPVLERDMRGEEAIRALGDHLPAVAAQNDMTPAAFRAALRADSMLWVSRTGQLLFVDEFDFGGGDDGHDHVDGADPALETTTVPAGTDVFKLHSRVATSDNPAPERVIVLDFNGHDARGTAWGSTSSQIAAPYSIDADPSTFSEAERAEIYGVWKRVAEDYAPFDVDVTTEDPGHGPGAKGAPSIRRDTSDDRTYGTRVVITPTKTYNCSCGGVAYVGVYDYIGDSHDKYQPAWVFTTGVGTGAKSIAEAVSHEAGHNLGLSHDGTRSTNYYTGHGDWAPIMGVGYYEPITQWSRGEYSGASNREDDFAVMQSNGAPPDADDIVGSVSLATGTTTVAGLIGAAEDQDHFTFGTTGGTVTIDAQPAAVSPNLDIQLQLVDANGVVLATVDPPSDVSDGKDLSLGLGAALTTILPSGTYTLVLDGVGFGDPGSTGYSDYGSIGRYTLSVDVSDDGADGSSTGGGGTTEPEPDPDPTSAPSAPSGFTVEGGTGTATLRWTDGSDNEAGFEIQREFLHKSNQWRGTTTWNVGAGETSHLDSPGSGTFRYRIRAFNSAGPSAYASSATSGEGWVQVTLSGGGGGGNNKGKGGSAFTAF